MTAQGTALPIAVQLYTFHEMPDSLEDKLAKVAAAGFSAVETIGDHGMTAEHMSALLDKYHLQVISTHVPLDALQNDLPGIIAFNRAIGNSTLVVPYIPGLPDAQSASPYQENGPLLGGLAGRCRAEGMKLLYHNHNWELKEHDGRTGLDWLFESAGPDLGCEPDLAWIAAAGVDPVSILERFANRVPRVHVKDLAPKDERPEDAVNGAVLADVGSGTLDWPHILPAARDAGAEWYIVEHDNPRDPVASISSSLAFLRRTLPAVLHS